MEIRNGNDDGEKTTRLEKLRCFLQDKSLVALKSLLGTLYTAVIILEISFEVITLNNGYGYENLFYAFAASDENLILGMFELNLKCERWRA